MTTYAPAQAEHIYKLFLDGHKPAIIAKALEMPEYRVKAIIKVANKDTTTFRKVMSMKKTGMTDSDIARALGISKQHVQRMTGLKERTMGEDAQNFTLTMSREEWGKVQAIAEHYGLIVDRGKHGGQGSVRKLLEQIARGTLSIVQDRLPDL